jgi:tRNA A37 methylthiotransferase MiaB
MKRKYSAKEFKQNIAWLKGKIPNLTLATDVIVGFPGESEADFQETVKLLKAVKPDVVNISRFGARPNTPAAKMGEQVAGIEKKERSRKLSDLCLKLAEENNAKLKGKAFNLLVSEKGRKGFFRGRTESYKPVIVKEEVWGEFARVKVVKTFPTYGEGKVLALLEKP